jgi:DNA repair protein RadD
MKFCYFLWRTDEEMKSNLLGGAVVRLVTMLDPSLASPTRLRELLVDLYSPSGLFLTPRYRT